MKTLIAQILIIGVLVIMLSITHNSTKIYSKVQNSVITYPEHQSFDFDILQREVDIPIPNVSKFKYKKCMKYDRYIQGLEATDIEKSWLHSVMFCESTCRENVSSPSGTYKGLYQFNQSTFDANCSGNIWNGNDQIVCALKLYRKGETFRWPNCP